MTKRNAIVFALMLLLGIGISYWSFRQVDLQQFSQDLRHAQWWWLLVALGAMIGYLLLEAVVTKLFVDDAHEKLTWSNAIKVPLVEQFGNGITPFATGGQPMQMITLIRAGVDPGRAGSILLMKFVVYQFMIVVNFIMALLIGYHYVATKLQAWSLLVILGFIFHVIVIVMLILVMYWPTLTNTLMRWLFKPIHRWWPKRAVSWETVISEKIVNFHEESRRLSRNWRTLLKTGLVTWLQLAVYYLIPYFILLGLGIQHVNLILVVVFHILIVMVISLFPIPGGTGGAEAGFSVLFAQFIPDAALLVFATLIWRLITYYFGMFAGIVAFNWHQGKGTHGGNK